MKLLDQEHLPPHPLFKDGTWRLCFRHDNEPEADLVAWHLRRTKGNDRRHRRYVLMLKDGFPILRHRTTAFLDFFYTLPGAPPRAQTRASGGLYGRCRVLVRRPVRPGDRPAGRAQEVTA